MRKRVLVFPCGSEIGLEIYNSVKDSIHFELFGLSSTNDHGKFVYSNYIEGIGFYTDPSFISDLKLIVLKYDIDIIYPTMDSVISHLKFYESELGVPVVGPNYELAKICASKSETYNKLKGKIKIPKLFFKNDQNLEFPLFVKPDVGYGSRNISKINNANQLKNINLDGMILCEYLPGKEFTIDCFTDLNGDLIFVGARERSRTSNGISVNTRSSKILTEKFRPYAEIINTNFDFKGSWFFQMKLDVNGDPCLLEIACRFAGSSAVHRIKGANFALANLFITQGVNPMFLINNLDVESDRSLGSRFKLNLEYQMVFIDYDDTIIINGEINLEAITFIYQCLNYNRNIILITKHLGNIMESLDRFKLRHLFSDILHLSPSEEKVDKIRQFDFTSAIFIDDSFEERRKVYTSIKIPVFSVDVLKALIK